MRQCLICCTWPCSICHRVAFAIAFTSSFIGEFAHGVIKSVLEMVVVEDWCGCGPVSTDIKRVSLLWVHEDNASETGMSFWFTVTTEDFVSTEN